MENITINDLMLTAFFECLVLVGIHSYLGLHVIRRKVIFVDLALAQMAVLGATVGIIIFNFHPTSWATYIFSLIFTIVGAILFSLTRLRDERVPQEAIIGLFYAIAAAVAILLITQNDAKALKKIMTGNLLFLDWPVIIKAAVIYSIIGIFHYIFRRKFILISENPQKAWQKGINVRLWDFLFYLSFGVVISISVDTAGVLLVFVFLVAPAIIAMLITNILFYQLIIGWTLGTLVSFSGLLVSFFGNLPSGPVVVCIYGLVMVLLLMIIHVARAKHPLKALLKVASYTFLSAAIFFGFIYGAGAIFPHHRHVGHQHAKPDHHSPDHHDHSKTHGADQHHNHRGHSEGDKKSVEDIFQQLENMPYDQQVSTINKISKSQVNQLIPLLNKSEDDELKILVIKRVLEFDQYLGIKFIINLLEQSQFPFVRSELLQILTGTSNQNFGYDPEKNSKSNEIPLDKIKNWAQTIKGRD